MTLTKSGISSLPAMRPIGQHPIERMLANGELPIERDCVSCGCETGESFTCVVQCETKGGRLLDFLQQPILFLFAPIWFVPLIRRCMEAGNLSAEDRFVRIQIRLCERCRKNIQLTPQNQRLLACRTSIYRDLFEEFPNACIQGKRTFSSPVAAANTCSNDPIQDNSTGIAFCSICNADVTIDDDDRCIQCRWPV